MPWAILVLASALVALLAIGFVLLSTGGLTVDTGWGRRLRPLGPQIVHINAPRDIVFDQIRVPYLSVNPPRELREKITVLERSAEMVVAAHRTKGRWFTTVTVESVTFTRPEQIAFRLLRGPVPLVTERFLLREVDAGAATELEYRGELGTDLWGPGALWGRIVAGAWEHAVAAALLSLKTSAELMATRAAARSGRDFRGL